MSTVPSPPAANTGVYLRRLWPICLIVLSACAEGGLERLEGTSPEGDLTDTSSDGVLDLSLDTPPVPDRDADTVPDQSAPDTTAAGDPDVGTLDLGGECEPYSVTCTEDGYAIQRCSADGHLLEPSPCALDEVCVLTDDDGAECAPCIDHDSCREDEIVCVPGEPFCVDFETAAVCGDDGQPEVAVGCAPGRCLGGGCITSGNQTGEACTTADDCIGHTCVCGDGDPMAATELCDDVNLAAGYCTTASCGTNGCDPESELCADFSLSGAFGAQQYCLLRENCGTRLGACKVNHRGDDHVCRALPSTDWTGALRSWGLACWVPPPPDQNGVCETQDCLSPIGGACIDDMDCVGGLCLKEGDLSYCAATCGETQSCPDYSACVRLNDTSTSFLCLARANDADCPRLSTTFDLVTHTLTTIDLVTTAGVCFFSD